MNNNITPLLMLAVAAALFYVYINPTYASLQELRTEKQGHEEALAQVAEIQALRQELLARYDSFSEEDLNRLNALLPDSVDNVGIMLDIDGIAQNYNYEMRNIKITRPSLDNLQTGTGSKPYGALEISFSFDSTYSDFVDFMRELEQSLRLIDVSNVAFRPTEEGIYTYNVTLMTYWLK